MTEIIHVKQNGDNWNEILCQQTFRKNHTENSADELIEEACQIK